MLEIMNGQGPADLRELCDELSAWMFLLGGRVETLEEGQGLAAEMIASGQAREKFREIIRLQGGDPRIVDDPEPFAPRAARAHVTSPRGGYVTAIQCEQIGIASMMLGGGREKMLDKIDPAVGLVLEKKIGDAGKSGRNALHNPLQFRCSAPRNRALLARSFEIGAQAPIAQPLVRKIIGA